MDASDSNTHNVSDDDPDASYSASFASMKAKVKHVTKTKPLYSIERNVEVDAQVQNDSAREDFNPVPSINAAEPSITSSVRSPVATPSSATNSGSSGWQRSVQIISPVPVRYNPSTREMDYSTSSKLPAMAVLHSSADKPVAKKLKLIDALPMVVPNPAIPPLPPISSTKESHKGGNSHGSLSSNTKKKKHENNKSKGKSSGQHRLLDKAALKNDSSAQILVHSTESKPKRGRPAKNPKPHPTQTAPPPPHQQLLPSSPSIPSSQQRRPSASSRRTSLPKQQQQHQSQQQQPAKSSLRKKVIKKSSSDNRKNSRAKSSEKMGFRARDKKRARTTSRLPIPLNPGIVGGETLFKTFAPAYMPCEYLQCPNVAPPSARFCLQHAAARSTFVGNFMATDAAVDADNSTVPLINMDAENLPSPQISTVLGAPVSSAEDICEFASTPNAIEFAGYSDETRFKCNSPSLNAQMRSSRMRATKNDAANSADGNNSIAPNLSKHFLPFTNYCSTHAAWALEKSLTQQNAASDNVRLGSNLVQHVLNSYCDADGAPGSATGAGEPRSLSRMNTVEKEHENGSTKQMSKRREQLCRSGNLFQLRMPYADEDSLIKLDAAIPTQLPPLRVDKAYSTFLHDDIDFADCEQQSAAINSTLGGVLQTQSGDGGCTSVELIDQALDKCLELMVLYNSAKQRCTTELRYAYTTYVREARQEAETLGSCRSTSAKLPGQTVDYERTRARLGACKLSSREKWLLRDELPLLEEDDESSFVNRRKGSVAQGTNCIYRTVKGDCCANRAAPLSQFCCTHIGFDRTQHLYTTCPVIDGDVCGVSSVPFMGHKFCDLHRTQLSATDLKKNIEKTSTPSAAAETQHK